MKQNHFLKNCSFSMLKLMIIMACVLLQAYCDTANDTSVYTFKSVISTDTKLTRSLAVSPVDNHVIIGSKEGQLKVYNFETGRLVWQSNQQRSQITGILWQNTRQGLITISFNAQQNKSVAILREVNGFQQVHRWQFPQLIYNADSVSNNGEQFFVGFNFMTRVEEYSMRTRVKKIEYLPSENRRFVEMSYSSQYRYLFLSGNGEFMYAFRCASVYRFYYGIGDIISRFEADKHTNQHSPVIYKKQYTGFELLDPSFEFDVSFPTRKIDYFKYCPRKYILGVDLNESIVIYTRDYQFTELAVIDTFTPESLFIVTVACENDHIIVTASDDRIYAYQLRYQHEQASRFWVVVVGVAAAVALGILVVLIVVIKRKVKKGSAKAGKSTLSPSLLTNDVDSSIVSELSL